MSQIYICDSCHYLLEKADDSDRCPDCGKQNIRPANKQNTDSFASSLGMFQMQAKKTPHRPLNISE